MNGDIVYSLIIRAEGGDTAATEILKSQTALNQVNQSASAFGTTAAAGLNKAGESVDGLLGKNEKMKEDFASPFQHAGIYLFSRQLLNTVGLGQLAQHAFAAIDIGMTSVAGSFGIAASTLGPLLLALGVGITVFELYEKKTKASEKSLKELNDTQMAAMDSTISLTDKLKKYVDELGDNALPAIKRLLQAEIDLGEQQKKNAAVTEGKQADVARTTLAGNAALLRSINAQIASLEQLDKRYANTQAAKQYEDQIKHLKESAQALNTTISQQIEIVAKSDADRQAQAKGYKDAADMAEKLAAANEKSSKDSQKFMDEWAADFDKDSDKIIAADNRTEAARVKNFDAVTAGLAKLKEQTLVMHEQELQSTLDVEAKKKAAIDQFRDQHLAAIKTEYDKLITAARGNAAEIVKIKQAKAAAVIQLNATVAAKQRQDYSQLQVVAGQAYDSITSGISQAAATAVLKTANAHDKIIALTKSVEQEVVASLIRIAVQAAITKTAVEAVFVAG